MRQRCMDWAEPVGDKSEKKVDLGSTEQFVEGKPYAVRVGERDLVIVRKGDEFFAIRDACPHQGARLSTGYVTGEVEQSVPGEEPRLTRFGEFLGCPWHGWKVDVRTGCSAFEPDGVLTRTYPVVVENGNLFVEVRA
jgi:nitrite reductase/ring-hydroxylating ferredoxin subunit